MSPIVSLAEFIRIIISRCGTFLADSCNSSRGLFTARYFLTVASPVGRPMILVSRASTTILFLYLGIIGYNSTYLTTNYLTTFWAGSTLFCNKIHLEALDQKDQIYISFAPFRPLNFNTFSSRSLVLFSNCFKKNRNLFINFVAIPAEF